MITSINPSSLYLLLSALWENSILLMLNLWVNFRQVTNFSVDPGNVILEELESSMKKLKVVAYVNLDEIGDNSEKL